MKYPGKIFLIIMSLLFLFTYHLYGDLIIELEYPEFPYDEIDELENELNQYFYDIENYVENEIDKEDMMKAFSEANAFNFSAISHPVAYNFQSLSFSLNTTVSSQLFSSDYEEIALTFSETSLEDDIYFGFGFQPFTCSLLFYLKFFFPALPDSMDNLIVGLNIGGSDILYLDYYILKSFNIGITAHYTFFHEQELLKMIRWHPLYIYTGFSYFSNSISIPFSFDRSFPLVIDPDDIGPEPEITGEAEIQLTPEVSISSHIFVFPVVAVTTFDIGWFFILDIGCGFDLLFGNAYISIEDETDISVTGDLSQYVQSIGNIIVTGNVHKNNPDFIRFKVSAAIGFHIDPIWIKIPLIYYFNNGISAGIKIGLSY